MSRNRLTDLTESSQIHNDQPLKFPRSGVPGILSGSVFSRTFKDLEFDAQAIPSFSCTHTGSHRIHDECTKRRPSPGHNSLASMQSPTISQCARPAAKDLWNIPHASPIPLNYSGGGDVTIVDIALAAISSFMTENSKQTVRNSRFVLASMSAQFVKRVPATFIGSRRTFERRSSLRSLVNSGRQLSSLLIGKTKSYCILTN